MTGLHEVVDEAGILRPPPLRCWILSRESAILVSRAVWACVSVSRLVSCGASMAVLAVASDGASDALPAPTPRTPPRPAGSGPWWWRCWPVAGRGFLVARIGRGDEGP